MHGYTTCGSVTCHIFMKNTQQLLVLSVSVCRSMQVNPNNIKSLPNHTSFNQEYLIIFCIPGQTCVILARPSPRFCLRHIFMLNHIKLIDKSGLSDWLNLARLRAFLMDLFYLPFMCSLILDTTSSTSVNTFRPRQNGCHFADDTLERFFLNQNVRNSINISLKFVPKGWIHNITSLVQMMAWRRPGDKPLSEPMMARLLAHICVTRPQWVNSYEIFGQLLLWID